MDAWRPFPAQEQELTAFIYAGDSLMRLVLFTFFMVASVAIQASDWHSRLQGGGEVTVNPNTNRATVTTDGVTTQLWKGTHRMQDGSILIIHRGGVAVPNLSILETRQLPAPEPEEWEDIQIVGYSPCEKLVRTVCGRESQCADSKACSPSQQLLAMEREERDSGNNPNLMSYTSGQCLTASRDKDFFAVCKIRGKEAGKQ